MKTHKIKAVAGFFTILILAFTSCEKNTAEASDDLYATFLLASADGISVINKDMMLKALGTTSDLTPDEIMLLTSMRNEEKLARDVYGVLAEKWNHPVFGRIAAAENTHLTAVNSLMKYYKLADTLITEPGVFTDKKVQDLYNEYIAKGSVSIEDAFKAGALIEEKDILDLREAVTQTSNENIDMVFSNLERGSRNHLRAFNRQLKFRGISYIPVYITQADYDKIVNSPVETGNRYRMNPGGTCIRGN